MHPSRVICNRPLYKKRYIWRIANANSKRASDYKSLATDRSIEDFKKNGSIREKKDQPIILPNNNKKDD